MALKKIKNNTKGRGYCGPTALAAITGHSLKTVLDAIRDVKYPHWRRDRREYRILTPNIRGVEVYAMRAAARKLGWDMRPYDFHPESRNQNPTTIEGWVARNRGDRSHYIFTVESDRDSSYDFHYVAVSRGKALDTFTKGVPVPVREFIHRANRVKAMWILEREKS